MPINTSDGETFPTEWDFQLAQAGVRTPNNMPPGGSRSPAGAFPEGGSYPSSGHFSSHTRIASEPVYNHEQHVAYLSL